MKTVLVIYFRALIIYLVFSLPAMLIPIVYIISAFYAFLFGWFALAVFAIMYLFLMRMHYAWRAIVLLITITMAIGFAFHMIGVLGAYNDVWNSGALLLFPCVALIAAWTSFFLSWKQVFNARSPNDSKTNNQV